MPSAEKKCPVSNANPEASVLQVKRKKVTYFRRPAVRCQIIYFKQITVSSAGKEDSCLSWYLCWRKKTAEALVLSVYFAHAVF